MTDLWMSLSSYGGASTREALCAFEQAGIVQVELAIGPRPDRDASVAISEYAQRGFRYRAHHAFVWTERHFPLNFAQAQLDWNYLLSMVNWLAEQGVTAYSVHAGHYDRNSEPQAAYDQFLKNLDALDQICRSRGITLGVETMYVTSKNSHHQYLLNSSEAVLQFCQDIPEIQIVLDLAHLNIWQAEEKQTKLNLLGHCANRLLEIHISDNDGKRDLHSRITPETWWMPWRSWLPKIPIVLESRLQHLNYQAIQREYHQILTWLSEHHSAEYITLDAKPQERQFEPQHHPNKTRQQELPFVHSTTAL